MQEVRFIYQESSLDELFTLEGIKLKKIEDYCSSTSKEIETRYHTNTTEPLVFILEIIITQK